MAPVGVPSCVFFFLVFITLGVSSYSQESILQKFDESLANVLQTSQSNNWVISPLSIFSVLSMVYLGSNNETQTELGKVLGLSPDPILAEQQIFKIQNNQLSSQSENLTWVSANQILINKKYHLKMDFLNNMKNHFHSNVDNEDFKSAAAIASKVNNWVANTTNNFITELVTPDAIDSNSITILLNGVFFKGNWKREFIKDYTTKSCFYATPYACSKVDMMLQKGNYNYFESEVLQAKFLEIPYADDDYSMIIVLPLAVDGLNIVTENLKGLPIEHIREMMVDVDVSIKIPKFEIEFFVDLKNILIKLGAKKMFSDTADLSNMIEEVGAKVSAFLHKSRISVTETGTVAAAATGALATRLSVIVMNPRVFYADHPFMYFIYKKQMGVVFVGQVLDYSLE